MTAPKLTAGQRRAIECAWEFQHAQDESESGCLAARGGLARVCRAFVAEGIMERVPTVDVDTGEDSMGYRLTPAGLAFARACGVPTGDEP